MFFFSFLDYYLENQSIYTSDIPAPSDPANGSSDWILRSHINIRERLMTIEYDPPIVAQHVAIIRSDTVELGLVEVLVYGKFSLVLGLRIILR